MTALELAQQLKARFPGLISEPVEFRGEITLQGVGRRADAGDLRGWPSRSWGLITWWTSRAWTTTGTTRASLLVYHLYGYGHLCQLRLKTDVSEEKGEVPTVTGVWRTADWHEREIYDMMGIRFRGHPDLRRILMWEGYPYFPLRKDFPLAGKPTDVPEVAFTEAAPLEGGPFVTIAGGKDTIAREPRVRIPESDALETNARVERRQDIKESYGHAHGPGPIEPKH